MERTPLRNFWPEITLIAGGLIFVLIIMVTASSHACHQWKQQLNEISGAFMGAAGAEEHPATEPERGGEQERTEIQNAARHLLAERPFGCL
jgi:hypothetical protein